MPSGPLPPCCSDQFNFEVTDTTESSWLTLVSTTAPTGSDLIARIAHWLSTKLARVEGRECPLLKLWGEHPEYAYGPVKIWDCENAPGAFDDTNLKGTAVEILQAAKNFVESFVEGSWRFEVHFASALQSDDAGYLCPALLACRRV